MVALMVWEAEDWWVEVRVHREVYLTYEQAALMVVVAVAAPCYMLCFLVNYGDNGPLWVATRCLMQQQTPSMDARYYQVKTS
jgi:hypothetical protein